MIEIDDIRYAFEAPRSAEADYLSDKYLAAIDLATMQDRPVREAMRLNWLLGQIRSEDSMSLAEAVLRRDGLFPVYLDVLDQIDACTDKQ